MIQGTAVTSDYDSSKPDGESSWLASYPSHLTQTWELPSGEWVQVRPIRHDDGPLEEAFVRGLSPETGYRRMLKGGVKVTSEWIDSMTHIDYRRHMAFAVTTAVEGFEQFIGVGRYVVEPATQSAEFALVLADDWQGKGVGRRLLGTLLEHARNAGVREMVGVVLARNAAMLELARSMGFSVSAVPEDATIVNVSLPLQTNTQTSS
jgi:acetyltransferase